MSTDTTLAPCPWCGEVPDAALDVCGTAIECPSCGTCGPAGCDAAEAVKAWQRRAPAPAYRLLERSDRIAHDDEFLDDDATTWAKDAGGLFVGMLYAPGALRPGRRVIKQ